MVNKDGLTPLRLAVQNGKLEVVNYLIVEQNVDLKGRGEQLSIGERVAVLFDHRNYMYRWIQYQFLPCGFDVM